jgi:hypothetical protein
MWFYQRIYGFKAMMYQLIIICQTFAMGNICLFQISDEWEQQEVYPVIWVSRPITSGFNGATVTFSWNSELSVGCKSIFKHSSAKTLVAVRDSVFITAAADPKDRGKKAFLLSHKNGAYQFQKDNTEVDDARSIILKTDWNIPNFPQAEAGLCVDESFICLVQLGPNLTYRIDTERDYGLLFGTYHEGDRINPADIKNSLRFSLQDFNEYHEKTLILQSDNTFLPIESGEERTLQSSSTAHLEAKLDPQK